MSRFLVDTQLLLWSAAGSRKLPAAVARLFRDGRHEFYMSAASLWEVAIKASLGRADFQVDAAELRGVLADNGFRELPIACSHAVAIKSAQPVTGEGANHAVCNYAHAIVARIADVDIASGIDRHCLRILFI